MSEGSEIELTDVSRGDSPTNLRKIHPGILSPGLRSASPGLNSSDGFSNPPEEDPLIEKPNLFKKYGIKIIKKLALPVIFFLVLSILFIVMYTVDWKPNYPDLVSKELTIFLVCFVIMMFVLLLEVVHAGIVLMTTVAILLYCGVIKTSNAFSGFSDSGTMTVLAVCIISDAINRTGALAMICKLILPNTKQKHIFPTLLRIVPLFIVASIFLNNTPIVAMGISIILSVSKSTEIAPSKLLMQMNFATGMGGMASLIGTSPNMVAKGLIDTAIKTLNDAGKVNLDYSMPLFEIAYVALPLAIIGGIYLIFCNFLLPENKVKTTTQKEHLFVIPLVITDNSQFIGKKIIETPLGRFPNTELPIVVRQNVEVSTETELEAGDVLIYRAAPNLITEVMQLRGVKVEDTNACNILLETQAQDLKMYEVSFAANSIFNNQFFPTEYEDMKFGIFGISDDNDNIETSKQKPIFFFPVSPSSSYLIITKASFTKSETYPLPFRIGYELPINLPVHYPMWKAIAALTALIIPIILDVMSLYKIVVTSFLSIAALVILGILNVKQVYGAVNVGLICTLGASFGLSAAMTATNAGTLIANTLTTLLKPIGKIGLLFGLGIPTILLTQLLSNNATIAVMFPIVWSAYLGTDPNGLTAGQNIGLQSAMYVMMICASTSFILPFGYQTNLMVMKDGGYKVKHFIKYGTILALIYLIGSCLISYLFFEGVIFDPILPTVLG